MTKKQIEEANFKHGTIHSIHWSRTLSDKEVLKGFKGGRITKETIGNFRIGVSYENMAINKDKKTGSLPYGYFEYSNLLIYSPISDTYQLRLTLTGREDKNPPKVKWYLDGKEITKEELIEMNALGAAQRKNKKLTLEEDPVFNLKLGNIIEIK